MSENPVLWVFILAGITALCTGLGAIPFAFLKEISDRTPSVPWCPAISLTRS